MAKAIDRNIFINDLAFFIITGIMITTRRMPTIQRGIRAQLHHPLRNGCAWEGMARSCGTDKWVNIIQYLHINDNFIIFIVAVISTVGVTST